MPGRIVHSNLDTVLQEARRRGFLGSAPIGAQIEHSLAFTTVAKPPTGLAIDLGSGGGLPGLPLALAWTDSNWLLLDASARRTSFLADAVEALGLADRVKIRCQRAEEAGRDPELRGRADLVVARSFGPPAATAECAAALTRVGGVIVVAEPPGGDSTRWPAAGLAMLGLSAGVAVTAPVALQRLDGTSPCPERFPRRTGIPEKRPLW